MGCGYRITLGERLDGAGGMVLPGTGRRLSCLQYLLELGGGGLGAGIYDTSDTG